jgi:hypothetical protein
MKTASSTHPESLHPDDLAKRMFVLVIAGAVAYVAAIIGVLTVAN